MANHPCPPNGDKEKKENMEKRKEELQATIEKQDDRVNHLQTSAFNLANYYFVFQGILLGAIVTATTALRCSDRWFLFGLSLIAAILNLVSLLVIGGNYKRSVMQRHQSKIERNKLESDLAKLETSPSDHGLKSDILSYWTSTKIEASGQVASQDLATVEIKDEPEQRQIRKGVVPVDNQHKQLRDFYFLLCMALFVCFSVIVIVGCWTIPCKKALQCIPPISSNDNCIRVCEGGKCMSMCTEY
ncbi:hypothetical protein PRUPE_1G470100 [Prunus persica]|uniref:Transmembrane protein n=1 Tax=Prunus persica TaxID=3760 RepID=A0A251RDT7_PRUPE|nr:uncharacterized protein LOC18791347 [Prunus persica]ONI34239.1 hypothetical protein PRUPE_1G470100 [Prunus persica]